MVGYGGKLLRVNLTDGTLKEEPFLEENARKYLGGRGMAAKILLEEQDGGIDPLGENAKLVFMSGPLSGTALFGTPRLLVAGKSPLTGEWGEAVAGGFFAHEFKRTGIDGIILEGQSAEPVYLLIRDGKAQLCSAEKLWGMTCPGTEEALRQEVGLTKCQVASIGPAGEKLARIASIMHGYDAFGRCGLGAVMGSKKLKAIVVAGHKDPEYADKKRLQELSKDLLAKLKESPMYGMLNAVGTCGVPAWLNGAGMLPTKNFHEAVFEDAASITLDPEKYEITHRGCRGCPVVCKKLVPLAGKLRKTPEYETAAAFGSLCLNNDYESIFEAGDVCDDYGLDAISTGVAVAFGIELFEKGILTEEQTDGLKLSWGDAEAIVELTKRIATRQGWIGATLSEGVRIASEIIGKGSEECAMHVKGLEIPMHTPRAKKSLGFNYCTSVRGACHCQAEHDPSFAQVGSMVDVDIVDAMHPFQVTGKARATKISHDFTALRECLITCLFTSPMGVFTLEMIADTLEACTGLTFSPEELLTIGERAHNLCRLFSLREGLSRAEEHLPSRFEEEIPEGPSQGQTFTREATDHLLDQYYALRGWSKDGVPTTKALERLDLSDFEQYL